MCSTVGVQRKILVGSGKVFPCVIPRTFFCTWRSAHDSIAVDTVGSCTNLLEHKSWYVHLGKLFTLSVLQFFHVQNVSNKCTYLPHRIL